MELSVSAHARLAALHSVVGAARRASNTAREATRGSLDDPCDDVSTRAADWILRWVAREVS